MSDEYIQVLKGRIKYAEGWIKQAENDLKHAYKFKNLLEDRLKETNYD